MKPCSTSTVLLFLLAGAATAQLNSDEESTTLIVGGTEAAPGAWPAFVAPNLSSPTQAGLCCCGGSLIHPEWFMTAAHCPERTFKSNGVRVGNEEIYNPDSGTVRQVTSCIKHPNFNPLWAPGRNDIMLCKLASPVTDVTPIEYEKNPSTQIPADGTQVTAIGFGRTSTNGPISTTLLQVNLRARSPAICRSAYGSLWRSGILMCAEGPNGPGQGVCTGDSGGPLLMASTSGHTVVGISNFGAIKVDGCAGGTYPDGFARVGAFANWIENIIGGGRGEGGKALSRRRLQSTTTKSMNPGDETYQAYIEACGHFKYPLFLHVDEFSHFLVYGVPPHAAVEAGCPFGAGHVIFVTRQGKPVSEKEILIWSNVEEGLSMFKEKESLPLGTFKLADLAEAYEATPDVDADGGANSGVYDIVTNNCVTYGIKLASTLGIKIDGRITSFVVRRLLQESGKDLADKIRSSINYISLLFGADRNLRSSSSSSSMMEAAKELTDQEVVEALVNQGASLANNKRAIPRAVEGV